MRGGNAVELEQKANGHRTRSTSNSKNCPGTDRIILCDIPWETYKTLRNVEVNNHVRMDFHDGVLELMSPQYRHDKSASRLDWLILTVAEVFAIPCFCSRATTFQRKGEGPTGGVGKEADTSFYFAHAPAIRGKDEIDLSIDPPPDLAIEVDNTSESESKLPIYAILGVPEVWLYDVGTRSLEFRKRQPDGSYSLTNRSESLPMLTPQLVMEGLVLAPDAYDSEWLPEMREWAKPGPPCRTYEIRRSPTRNGAFICPTTHPMPRANQTAGAIASSSRRGGRPGWFDSSRYAYRPTPPRCFILRRLRPFVLGRRPLAIGDESAFFRHL